MDLAASLTLSAGALAATCAALAWRLSRAPLWSHVGRFATVAALTAAFALLDALRQGPFGAVPPGPATRPLEAIAILLTWSWLGYADVLCGLAPGVLERRLRSAMPLLAAVALVPGVAMVPAGSAAAPGGAWSHAQLTRVGIAIGVLLVAASALVLSRLVRAWLADTRGAGLVALGYGLLVLVAIGDVLAQAGYAGGPHLLGLAIAVPLLAAAWAVARQFVADAGALQALRDRLEGLVEERTRELAEAQTALLNAEKLAALGQFAAGVGHEVNNPASVVTANLSLLAKELPGGMDAGEAREVVEESVEAMHRINELVRKLLDAGRLADLPPSAGTVELAAAAARAVDAVRARSRAEVELASHVADDLLVRGGDELVQRILANLLANALDAIPAGRRGRVELSARADGATVVVTVADDGAGMPADVLRRAFDPFFTTKPVGRGSGLGLPIARGLAEGIGGQVWLESEPGRGTRAIVELPAGRPG